MTTPTPNSSSTDAFCKLVNDCKNKSDITNIVFLMGAGFSKSWDDKAPLGRELFQFPYDFIEEHAVQTKNMLLEYAPKDIEEKQKKVKELENEIKELQKKIVEYEETKAKLKGKEEELKKWREKIALPYETLQEIVYSLSMQLKYPAIRSRHMDDNSIVMALNELKALTEILFMEKIFSYEEEEKDKDSNTTDFAGFHPRWIYPENTEMPEDTEMPVYPKDPEMPEEKDRILNFFKKLMDLGEKDIKNPKGIHFDFITTNYDSIIEGIMGLVLGSDEGFNQIYRGISPLKIHGDRTSTQIIGDYIKNTLLKINGGFEIQNIGETSYRLDYSRRTVEEIKQNPPALIMPSKEQNYTDHYFTSVFTKAVRLLQESQVLVVVGYSFPKEDAIINFIIKQFAESSYYLREKQIFYIGSAGTRGKTVEEVINDRKNQVKQCFNEDVSVRLEEENRIHIGFGFDKWAEEVVKKLNEKSAS